jgi:hypothetical protein
VPVPADQLLHPVRLTLHELVAEGARVVELLLDIGGVLVVDRDAIGVGAVGAGGMPQRRVEDDQRAARALYRPRLRLEVDLLAPLGL